MKLGSFKIQSSETFVTRDGYYELGYNELSVITNKVCSPKWLFATQTNPVITNPGYNKQLCQVSSCLLENTA